MFLMSRETLVLSRRPGTSTRRGESGAPDDLAGPRVAHLDDLGAVPSSSSSSSSPSPPRAPTATHRLRPYTPRTEDRALIGLLMSVEISDDNPGRRFGVRQRREPAPLLVADLAAGLWRAWISSSPTSSSSSSESSSSDSSGGPARRRREHSGADRRATAGAEEHCR